MTSHLTQIATALEEADATFGYRSEMVRLVDGISTRRLSINGEVVHFTDSETNDFDAQSECSAYIAIARANWRADALMAVPFVSSNVVLLAAPKAAETVVAAHVYPKPDVEDPNHPWSVLKSMRAAIAQAEGTAC